MVPAQVAGNSGILHAMTPISEAEVRQAQTSWAEGIIAMGAAPSWPEAHALAASLAKALYVVDGTLLFCPTKAAQRQFRVTLDEVVSYFVGRDDHNPEDQGFALTELAGIRFENAGVLCRGDHAIAMGNYFFRRPDGGELKAEFSFVYVRGAGVDGRLKIQLHHSALPYSG